VMAMPMPAFGMFVGKTRKIYEDRFNRQLMELCDIQSISIGGVSHLEALKGHYQGRLLNETQKKKRANPREFDMNVKEQSDQAASIMAAALRVKKRKMGLG